MYALSELPNHVGESLPPTEWTTITQDMVDEFGRLTGDEQWIHVDVERCRRESPFGGTIAHGFLVLSLIPLLRRGRVAWAPFSSGLNYGCDKVRFPGPTRVGSRVRMHETLKACEPYKDRGVKMTLALTIEVEGQTAPACYAEVIAILFP